MEYAIFLLILASAAVGVTASIVTTWSLRAKLFSLQDVVDRMEGTLLREVKARAGQERWKSPARDEALLAATLAQAKASVAEQAKPWWVTGLPRSHPG